MPWMVRLGIVEGDALFEVVEGSRRLSQMKQDVPQGMVAIQQAHGVLQAVRQSEALLRQRVGFS